MLKYCKRLWFHMMQVKSLFFTLFLLLVFVNNVSAESEFDIIKQGAEYGDRLITTGQGTISFVWTRVDSTCARAQELDRKAIEETPPEATCLIM